MSSVSLNANDSNKSLHKELQAFDERYSDEKQTASYLEITNNFFQSVSGLKNLIDLFRKACKWTVVFSKCFSYNHTIGHVEKIANNLKVLYQGFAFAKFPKTIISLRNCTNNIASDKNSLRKKISKHISEIAKTIVSLVRDVLVFIILAQCFLIYPFSETTLVLAKNYKDFFMLILNFFNIHQCKSDFNENEALHCFAKKNDKLDLRKRTIFSERKTLFKLEITKNIFYIASLSFLALEVFFGIFIIDKTAHLALTSIALLVGITAHFYEKSFTYKKIKT